MEKVKVSHIVKPVLKQLANPAALWRAASLQWRRKQNTGKPDDAQLGFYAELLQGDFLHYGYFDDTTIQPGDISVNQVVAAQERYAHQLLELANADREGEVLDIGCGMGGLVRLLLAGGFRPVAVSPDRSQIACIEKKYPGVPAFCSKFEDLDPTLHAGRYSTIFTSESLQYLRLPRALPLLEKVLKPGGTWVACDYFNRDAGNPARRLPAWPDFQNVIADAGWRFTSVRDITAHVLPTLSYIHMWATRAGLPAVRFALNKLQRKQPGVHHLVGGALPELLRYVDVNVDNINPETFARKKQYILFSLQRV